MLHRLENVSLPRKYRTTYVNFEEDNIRNLYVELIYLLTNLRSRGYSIQTLPKYKVQKYALDINRSNPLMHSVMVGFLCM